MTIVKINNPKLRWLAGFAATFLSITIGLMVLRAISYFAHPFFVHYLYASHKITTIESIVEGAACLIPIMVAILVIYVLYKGAKEFGDKLFK